MTEERPDTTASASVEDLARLAQAGAPAAREALAERLRPVVMSHLRRHRPRGADIEDLCQEALMRAFRGLDGYDPDRPLLAWVRTIADRVAVSRARKRLPDALGDGDALARADGPAPTEALRQAERRRTVWQTARANLSDRQYRALWLRYADGLDVCAVAGRLGLTRTHVKVLLHRARKKLLACPELRNEV